MKIKTLRFIAIITVITLSFAVALVACDNGNNDNGKPKTYTVTFHADNGTVNTTQTVTEGGKATKPANPTKDGYGFSYWFNEATGTEWDFDTIITASITLKAEWTPSCTITNHAIDDDLSCGHTAKEYGKINGIPVYRNEGVSDADAAAAYGRLVAAYAEDFGPNKPKVNSTNISQFLIISGSTPSLNPGTPAKSVFNIPVSFTQPQMEGVLQGLTGGFAMLRSNDAIRLATPGNAR
jgi:uncharacterized repeat protein (TIGR02543 family)